MKKELFGEVNGREVYLYTLENSHGMKVTVSSFGALIIRIWAPDHNGNFADVALGYDRLEQYLENGKFYGAVVAPNANRIGGAKFTLEGKTYELSVNDNGNNLHSHRALGGHKRIWDAEEKENGILFTMSMKDGELGFGGNRDFSVLYELTEENGLRITYDVVSDADTILNLTNHCYFNLAGHNSGPVLEQQVWLAADTYTPADAVSIPTGEILPVEGTPMDFRKMKPIGQDIEADFEALNFGHGYDHNWVLNHEAGVLGIAGKAKDPVSGRVMEAYTDLPGMQFYTANFLKDERPGKGGAHYDRRHAFCFETQYYPDACHKPNFPSPILKAGDTYKTTTIYKFYAE